jgi:hypothetical protein
VAGGQPVAQEPVPGSPPFRAALWLGRGLVGLLVLDIALAWLVLQATLLFTHVVWHALAGEFQTGSPMSRYGLQFDVLLRSQGAAWILTGVCFLVWIARVTRNLPALGTSAPAYSPRQAVGAFLAAAVSPVRPLAVMRAVWRGSDPREAPVPGRGGAATPPVLAWWWGVLAASILMDLTQRAGLGGVMPLIVVGEALRIAAAVLTIAVVLAISGNQAERAWRRQVPARGTAAGGRETPGPPQVREGTAGHARASDLGGRGHPRPWPPEPPLTAVTYRDHMWS